jgi:maleylpyruvate isomerase
MFDHVTTDPLALSEDLRHADDRLMATLARLSPGELAAPSPLPGWTRGHVTTHIARNADALGNLLTWAATGVETPAYATATARVEGIEAGAHRPLDEQIDDVRAACALFLGKVAEMPADAWSYDLTPANGGRAQGVAAKVVWRRLREVEIHHVDLGFGYTTADWPDAFTQRLIRDLVADRASGPAIELRTPEGQSWRIGDEPGDVVTITGPAHEIAGWLCGRSGGEKLSVTPDGALPTLPAWI